MTLKEKLNDSIITNINIVESENRMYYEYNHLELAEQCEVITDEFAIGFGCWLHQNLTHISKDSWGVYNGEWLTVNESLEIYKKEKQL